MGGTKNNNNNSRRVGKGTMKPCSLVWAWPSEAQTHNSYCTSISKTCPKSSHQSFIRSSGGTYKVSSLLSGIATSKLAKLCQQPQLNSVDHKERTKERRGGGGRKRKKERKMKGGKRRGKQKGNGGKSD